MKKLVLFFGSLSLLAFSCTKTGGELDNEQSTDQTTEITSVVGKIVNTRVSSTIVGDDFQSFWSTSDKIALTDLKSRAVFTLKSGAGAANGTFTGKLEAANSNLYAVYPASTATLSNGALRVTIPAEQRFSTAKGSNLGDKVVLLATSADNQTFDFNIAGAIINYDITLHPDREIRSVTVVTEQVGVAGVSSIDVEQCKLLSSSGKKLTLTYAVPVKHKSNNGWATIAPVNFKAATGKVVFDVVTDKGTYTFCHTPEQKFEAGGVYTVKLSVEDFVQVEDKSKLKQGEYFYSLGMIMEQPEDPEPEVDPNLNVRLVRATDSTLAVAWTITASNIPYLTEMLPNEAGNYATDITKTYKVELYSDQACTNLVLSVDNIQGKDVVRNEDLFTANITPPRFIFPGLEPATSYFVKVHNLTDGTSNAKPVQMSTRVPLASKAAIVKQNAQAGDLIAFENFETIIYAGDITTRAAGVSRTDRKTLTSFDQAPLKGQIHPTNEGYYMSSCATEIGLFNTLGGLVDDMKLQDWGWIGGKSGADGGSVCSRPGYLKIGTSGNRSFVTTPVLNSIPVGKVAKVRVVFNAAPYGDPLKHEINAAEKSMSVRALAKAQLQADNRMDYAQVANEVKLTLDGTTVADWKEYSVVLESVPSGGSIAIGGGESATTTNRMFVDDIRVYVESLKDAPVEPMANGYIKYSDGTPAAGVLVSDGYTVVKTNSDGYYKINTHHDAWYIYYTIPSDCQVVTGNDGQPMFYMRYNPSLIDYNFTLSKLSGGKESEFALLCLADPQCKDASHRTRFVNETVADIRTHINQKGIPCYGVTLGDVTYSEGSRNCVSQMPHLRKHMSKSNIGMPVFQTMGNHDYTYFSSSVIIEPDETSSTYNIKAQRAFEDVFGPINYSWDRGDAHIVCMRNMQWTANNDAAKYTMCFTDEQYEWLKQDLSFVPKDKMVIFCVHKPITNSSNKNVQKVVSLLKQFKETHIMSGHTHYMRNEPTLTGGMYEHVHAAVCGAWWWSRVNGDGCPNGYGVYDISGNTIKNWYYKGSNKGMNDRDYQIRLYRGNLKCGGTHEDIALQHGDGVLLANVFNNDSKWVVKVYENGVHTGNMTKISNYKHSPAAGNPTKPSTKSSQDWWAIGYHIGVVGRGYTGGGRANYLTNAFTMYKYTLKDKSATIRVEATDRFGRTYVQTQITGDYDYSLMY